MTKNQNKIKAINKNTQHLSKILKLQIGEKSILLKKEIEKFFDLNAYRFIQEVFHVEYYPQWKKFFDISQSSIIDSIVYLEKHQNLSKKIYQYCIPFAEQMSIDIDKWNDYTYQLSNILLDRRSQNDELKFNNLEIESITSNNQIAQYFNLNQYICYSVIFNENFSALSNDMMEKISIYYENFLLAVKNILFPSKELLQKINLKYIELFSNFIDLHTDIGFKIIDYKDINKMIDDPYDLFGQYKELLKYFKNGDINFVHNFFRNLFLIDLKCTNDFVSDNPHLLFIDNNFYKNIGFNISQSIEEESLPHLLVYLFLHHHPFNIHGEFIDHQLQTNVLCCSNIHDEQFIFLKEYFKDLEKEDYENYNIYLLKNWIKQKSFYLHIENNLVLKDIVPLNRIKLFILDGCGFTHFSYFLNQTEKIIYKNIYEQIISLEKELSYELVLSSFEIKESMKKNINKI